MAGLLDTGRLLRTLEYFPWWWSGCSFESGRSHANKRRRHGGEGVLVFNAQYTQQTKRLGLRRRIETLLPDLRGNIGDDFLQNTRILIAHLVQANGNIFARTYALNVLANRSQFT